MTDLSKCCRCNEPNKEDGVYTAAGCYLCATCCDVVIEEDNETN